MRIAWNKGKFGYHHKGFTEEGKENIRKGVKKAWEEGKYDYADYSKSDAQKKQISESKKKFYLEHPEKALEHSLKLRGKMVGESNPNYGKKHPGINAKEKNHFWKGGISYEPYSEDFDRYFKESIREREGNRCFLCKKSDEENNKNLHVHHIDYDKMHTTEDNCVALCSSCHAKTKKNREYWEELFNSAVIDRYPKISKKSKKFK